MEGLVRRALSDHEWSVAVSALIVEGEGVDVDDLANIVEILEPYAAIAGGQGNRLDVRLTVSNSSPSSAVEVAVDLLTEAAEKVGLGPPSILSLEALTAPALEAQLNEANFPALLGISEIAELLEVNRQRASQIARTQRFPAPVAELAMGPVWTEPSVRRFLDQWTRQPGRPRKEQTAHRTKGRS